MAAALCLGSALAGLVPVPPLTAGLLVQAVGIRVPQGMVRALSALLLVAAAAGVLRALIDPGYAVLAGWLALV